MLVFILSLQVALFSLGILQVQSSNQFIVYAGIFNIVVNAIFGALNAYNLFKP